MHKAFMNIFQMLTLIRNFQDSVMRYFFEVLHYHSHIPLLDLRLREQNIWALQCNWKVSWQKIGAAWGKTSFWTRLGRWRWKPGGGFLTVRVRSSDMPSMGSEKYYKAEYFLVQVARTIFPYNSPGIPLGINQQWSSWTSIQTGSYKRSSGCFYWRV